MKTLHVTVVNKVATYLQRDGDIVCGNSDYKIQFTFDSEWDAYTKKTARFIWNGKHLDVVFTGNTCNVPVIQNTDEVKVGVFAGELSTTTPAVIGCKKSILCGGEEAHGGVALMPDVVNVVQTTGTSETDIMSQKATTDVISEVAGGCVKTFTYTREHSSRLDQVRFYGKANDVVLITLDNEAGVGGSLFCYKDGTGTEIGGIKNGETVEKTLPVDCDYIGIYLYSQNNTAEKSVKLKVEKKNPYYSHLTQVLGYNEKDVVSQKMVTVALSSIDEMRFGVAENYTFLTPADAAGLEGKEWGWSPTPYRLCVRKIFYATKRMTLTATTDYKIAVSFLKDEMMATEDSFIRSTGWTTIIEIPKGSYFEITVKRSDEEKIFPIEYMGAFAIDAGVVQTIGCDEKDTMSQKAVTGELYDKIDVDVSQYNFSQGSMINGINDPESSPNQGRCSTRVFTPIPTLGRLFVDVVDGYKYEVDFFYNNKTFIKDTGWLATSKEIDIPETARYIKVIIAYKNDAKITPDVAIDKAKFVFYSNKFEKHTNEIPSYWGNAVETVESKIEQHQNDGGVNTFTFGFITDTHVFADTSDTYAKLMGRVLDTCDIPVFLHGGDIIIGSKIVSKDGLIAQILRHKTIFRSIEDKCLLAFGNHDSAYGVSAEWDSALTDGETYNYIFRKDQSKSNIVFGETGRYFYKDVPAQKVRYIVLDCYGFKTTLNGNTVVTNNKMFGGAKFGTKQLDWLVNTALKVDDGYSIVICSHQPPFRYSDRNAIGWSDDVMLDAEVVLGIVNAYRNKTQYTYSGSLGWDASKETYAVNVNFSDYKGDFVCWIAGHTHKDYIFDLDGLKLVCTANCSPTRSETEPEYSPVKTRGTDTECVMDFLCVNKATRTCDIVRLGAELESNADGRSFTY